MALVRRALPLGGTAATAVPTTVAPTSISTITSLAAAGSTTGASATAARVRGLHVMSRLASQSHHTLYRSSGSAVSASIGVLNLTSPAEVHSQPRRIVKTTADDILRHQYASFSTTGGADATSAAFGDEQSSSDGKEKLSEEQADADVRELILRQALSYVPKLGWSSEALAAAVNDLGLSSASIGLIQVG